MASKDKEKIKNQEMVAHLRRMGYPHGRRATSPVWPFNKDQIGSNKYVRYLKTRAARKGKST